MIPNERGWINRFVRHTANLPGPAIFRKWSAIAAVGAAAERRCWTTLRGMSPLYPNMLILLVAQPGVGKSVSVNAATHFLRTTHSINISAATMTKAAMIDTMKDSAKTFAGGSLGDMSYSSLFIPATEFGNLVPAYELSMMNAIIDLYDCREDFIERTRGGGEIKIDRPQISLLGATQPDYLSVIMPEAAWGMGFTSRIIMIYSDDRSSSLKSLFGYTKPSKDEHEGLARDLGIITRMKGEFRWTPEAAKALDEWHMSGQHPTPKAPRLQHYNTRRIIHLVKLMTIAALARHSMVIELCDFEEAIDWLFEAEEFMPEIFRAMVIGGDSAIMADTALWVREQEARHNRPVPHHRLVDFVRTRLKAGDVVKALEVMIAAKMIVEVGIDSRGKPVYTGTPEPDDLTPAAKPHPIPPSPDLFTTPAVKPSAESLVPAKYILRVPSEADEEEHYDADFYESHA